MKQKNLKKFNTIGVIDKIIKKKTLSEVKIKNDLLELNMSILVLNNATKIKKDINWIIAK